MREPEIWRGPQLRLGPRDLKVELRADSEGALAAPRIVGHAIAYESWTTLYEGRYLVCREKINRGACKRAIEEKQDVRCLFNHDSNWVLGRTASGTLSLVEDPIGVYIDCKAPVTQTIRDMVITPIERGDVSGMSFAFTCPSGGDMVTTQMSDGTVVFQTNSQRITLREDGDKTIEEREILDCDLFDVSPVTYPAYDSTDVAIRSRLGVSLDVFAERDRPLARKTPRLDSARRLLSARNIAG